ncbi:MAG: hypothetical protein WB987_01575 [Candidatus Acidiferrales bacterium]
MRRALWLAAAATIAVFPPASRCQQQDQAKSAQQSSASDASQATSQAAPQTPPAQQDSLADAARRAREQKKDTPKQGKVFTNDNIPTQGGISAVGAEPAAPAENAEGNSTGATKAGGSEASDEKKWRTRFAKLRQKLQQDQTELNVMQRELGVLDLQNYNDPVKGMQQELTRSDINDKTAKIAAKQKDIDADNQAISDAEDDLRKAGGDSGWAR